MQIAFAINVDLEIECQCYKKRSFKAVHSAKGAATLTIPAYVACTKWFQEISP